MECQLCHGVPGQLVHLKLVLIWALNCPRVAMDPLTSLCSLSDNRLKWDTLRYNRENKTKQNEKLTTKTKQDTNFIQWRNNIATNFCWKLPAWQGWSVLSYDLTLELCLGQERMSKKCTSLFPLPAWSCKVVKAHPNNHLFHWTAFTGVCKEGHFNHRSIWFRKEGWDSLLTGNSVCLARFPYKNPQDTAIQTQSKMLHKC